MKLTSGTEKLPALSVLVTHIPVEVSYHSELKKNKKILLEMIHFIYYVSQSII